MFRNLLLTILLAVTLLSSGTANAAWKDWTPYQKGAAVVSIITTSMDIAQTRYIYRHPERWKEADPITSHFKDGDNATIYLIVSEMAVLFVADYLPSDLRSLVLTTKANLNGLMVVRNNGLSIKMKW